MKAKLQSYLRHAFTGAATLGAFLGSHGLIDQADVAQTNADAAQAAPLIASIAAAILSRMLISAVAKYAPRLLSLLGESSSGTGVSIWAMGAAVGACALLPSCGANTSIPFTGSIYYRDTKSGAKGGLEFQDGQRPQAFLRVPIFKPDTGEKIGEADVAIPVGKAVDSTSGK